MPVHKPSSPELQRFHQVAIRTGHVVLVGPRATRFPSELAREAAVLGVDGGSALANAEEYHLTVGDGDSLPDSAGALDILLPTEKDQSDLGFALQCLPTLPLELSLWGFAGGRWDHDLANLGELSAHVAHRGGRARLLRDDGSVMHVLPAGEHHLRLEGGFSLFSLTACQMEIRGQCRFPLPPTAVAPFSSLTLSNLGHGEVLLRADAVFFCYQGVDTVP